MATVEGAARLRRTLKAAGVDMADMRAVNRTAANTVQAAAVAAAPMRTGRLKATVRAGATNRAGIIRAGRKAVPYGGPIHWGWPARGIRARPFITLAAQATEPVWVAQYEADLLHIIRQIKGK